MPEISEVRLMSEYINHVASKAEYFVGISKNPEHKSKTNLSLPFEHFLIKAHSRGKELQLSLIDMDFSYNEGTVKKTMTFTMGMSGNWIYAKDVFSIPKHTHLMFLDNSGGVLGLQDVRRFARWDWRGWNLDRSEDPNIDPINFELGIMKAIKEGKDRIFKKPIYEAMMEQKYFNGIGNYLRAEILGRIDLDPNLPAGDYINQNRSNFFETLQLVISDSYVLGGGQIKDWSNPLDVEKKQNKEFKEWMQFYFNKERCIPIKDKSGRTFWMDKKWVK